VDKNPAYPAALEALRGERLLSGWVRLRQRKYSHNIVEQDRRTGEETSVAGKGYGSLLTAWRTLQGIESMHMINKGRVRWLRAMRSAKLNSLPACSVSPLKRQRRITHSPTMPQKSFPVNWVSP
jgi:transposase-like protein